MTQKQTPDPYSDQVWSEYRLLFYFRGEVGQPESRHHSPRFHMSPTRFAEISLTVPSCQDLNLLSICMFYMSNSSNLNYHTRFVLQFPFELVQLPDDCFREVRTQTLLILAKLMVIQCEQVNLSLIVSLLHSIPLDFFPSSVPRIVNDFKQWPCQYYYVHNYISAGKSTK